jgi:hypothetical protein
MKKTFLFFLLFVFLGFATSLYSQTEKGRMIYGGGVGLGGSVSQPSSYFSYIDFSLSPQFGGFVTKNFAILATSNFEYYNRGFYYGIGPEFRFYAGSEKIKFYAFANTIMGGARAYVYPNHLVNRFNFNFSVGPGIAIFAGRNFSIHANIFFKYSPPYGPAAVGIGTTFNGLFGPRIKKEKILKTEGK